MFPSTRGVQAESLSLCDPPPPSPPNGSCAHSTSMNFIKLPFSTPLHLPPTCKSCSSSSSLFILHGLDKQVTYWCFRATFTVAASWESDCSPALCCAPRESSVLCPCQPTPAQMRNSEDEDRNPSPARPGETTTLTPGSSWVQKTSSCAFGWRTSAQRCLQSQSLPTPGGWLEVRWRQATLHGCPVLQRPAATASVQHHPGLPAPCVPCPRALEVLHLPFTHTHRALAAKVFPAKAIHISPSS